MTSFLLSTVICQKRSNAKQTRSRVRVNFVCQLLKNTADIVVEQDGVYLVVN